jgi:hypothetical protein
MTARVTHAAVDEEKDVSALLRDLSEASLKRQRKGLRSVNPVTPRRINGAADRIRTGDVQLGKVPLGVAKISRSILSAHFPSANPIESTVVAHVLPTFRQNLRQKYGRRERFGSWRLPRSSTTVTLRRRRGRRRHLVQASDGVNDTTMVPPISRHAAFIPARKRDCRCPATSHSTSRTAPCAGCPRM